MDRLLLRPGEAGEVIGMGRSKIYELIASGVIPSVRVGKSIRVPADSLRRWVQELQAINETSSPQAMAPQGKEASSK